MFNMLSSTSITLIFAASSVLASAHQGLNHRAIAKRMESAAVSLEKRDTFTGIEMTWYPTDTGPDACSGQNHQDSDFFVAMENAQFNDGGCCGKKLRINYQGKSAVATCVDACASCYQWGQLDMTKGLFEYLVGDLGIGEVFASWSYVDGEDDDQPKPKPTPTPTPKKPTPTPHKTTTTTHKVIPTSSKKPIPTTTTTHTSSSAKPSSSSIHTSSAKPSSSSPSSSVSSIPDSVPTVAANAGAGPTSGSDTTDGTDKVSGGIQTGSDSSAISLSFNKLLACAAALAVLAVQLP
ncbi:hypothetical protein C8J56DRAFT_519121 [Mycena floridula]|nr:hypothetical protein C8J56DRAFT_519121 [Mycena floridula]